MKKIFKSFLLLGVITGIGYAVYTYFCKNDMFSLEDQKDEDPSEDEDFDLDDHLDDDLDDVSREYVSLNTSTQETEDTTANTQKTLQEAQN